MTPNKLEINAEPNQLSFTTRRIVDAPREVVFTAFTAPEHLQRWLGPRSMTMVSCTSDLRVGGSYRFVHRTEEGHQFAFYGEYREVVRPERIVRTFVFEPMPDEVALETLVLEELAGKTLVSTTTLHKTVAARDGHLGAGNMELALAESYARLDELLATLRAR